MSLKRMYLRTLREFPSEVAQGSSFLHGNVSPRGEPYGHELETSGTLKSPMGSKGCKMNKIPYQENLVAKRT